MADRSSVLAGPSPADYFSAVGLIALFFVTRLLIAGSLLLDQVKFVANDLSYYGYHLNRLDNGESGVMTEYPVPAVWILQALYTLGGGWQHWAWIYVGFFLLLDAAVAISLFRRGNASGALFWILFTGASGAIVWYRFDLIPAALVAWACLLVGSHPRIAGGLIGLGAAIKLWPALLIGPLLAPHPLRDTAGRKRLVGFVVIGLGLAAASLLTSGWSRSASPITWQSERGLQIESVPASPLMFLRTFTHRADWTPFLSEYNALELSGPGVGFMLTVSTVLVAASIVATIHLSVRLLRHATSESPALDQAMLLAVLTIVLLTIIANKTLSPQYVLWLGGPIAALLALPTAPWLRRHLAVVAASVLVVAGLTQFTYPWGAYGIMAIPQGSGPETSVLLLRNAMLVALGGYAYWLTLRASRRAAFETADLRRVETIG
ncbi:MAG TPA: DUF2029 domain-containing protein [Tessaracoccus flavescens]|uniref:DUF2029 domain-containing protein n=1 Tax=Tessaracoccus flavescens TaxID=399497 RepID=A0A921ERL1_9ACTN|nr:DUF2029 domain-containing protein [Tessaracoccus flavescens]